MVMRVAKALLYVLWAQHERMRGLSLWTGLIGFGCFVQGLPEPALCIRIMTEILRLPSFVALGMRDQVRLCWLVMAGCVYGLWRLS